MNQVKKLCNIETFIILYLINILLSQLSIIPVALCSFANMFFYALTPFISLYIFYLRYKKYNHSIDKISLAIFLFFLFYIVTIIINRINIFNNFKSLIICMIQLIICFLYLSTINIEEQKLFCDKIFKSIIIISFIITLISLVLYSQEIVIKYGYQRYNGLFVNANNTSLCSISILLSGLYLNYSNKLRFFNIINIILSLMFISVSHSRGASFLAISFLIYIACLFVFNKNIKTGRKFLLSFGLSVLICIGYIMIFTATPYLTNLNLNKIQSTTDEQSIHYENISDTYDQDLSETSSDLDQNEINKGLTERDDQSESNSIRINLMKAGLNTFFKHPFFGVGSRNLDLIVESENPKLNLAGISGGGLHNTYMQLLVSNGILGFGMIAFILLYGLKSTFSSSIKYNNYNTVIIIIPIFIFLGYMCISSYMLFFNSIEAVLTCCFISYLIPKTINRKGDLCEK